MSMQPCSHERLDNLSSERETILLHVLFIDTESHCCALILSPRLSHQYLSELGMALIASPTLSFKLKDRRS